MAVKVEVHVRYGTPIPEKADELQAIICDEITRITGLHVATVHVIFKGIIGFDKIKKSLAPLETMSAKTQNAPAVSDYNDDF